MLPSSFFTWWYIPFSILHILFSSEQQLTPSFNLLNRHANTILHLPSLPILDSLTQFFEFITNSLYYLLNLASSSMPGESSWAQPLPHSRPSFGGWPLLEEIRKITTVPVIFSVPSILCVISKHIIYYII